MTIELWKKPELLPWGAGKEPWVFNTREDVNGETFLSVTMDSNDSFSWWKITWIPAYGRGICQKDLLDRNYFPRNMSSEEARAIADKLWSELPEVNAP